MVWVELHENEASRTTEHKRFYEATTGKWTDILRIQEKKHQNSKYHSLPKWLRKAKAFLADEYLHEIQTHQDQSYFLLLRKSASTVSKSARNHIINLKLALCIVCGEVEYAYCGPSCTAGKSGFFNHILALMCPLVWLYCLYEQQRAKRGEDYVWSRSLGYPPWETVLLLFKYFLPVAALQETKMFTKNWFVISFNLWNLLYFPYVDFIGIILTI